MALLLDTGLREAKAFLGCSAIPRTREHLVGRAVQAETEAAEDKRLEHQAHGAGVGPAGQGGHRGPPWPALARHRTETRLLMS
ncbi:MAG TPA: hypothetical protein VIR33_00680 [Thermopolyspora sp.]|jgi:hypothetical protein